ncbi:MAG: polyprenyl synthetase family protein [Bacteroidota bacterium]|nr:polyprenyl synthetase family protein [Bacteroidota bacterium]
MQTYGSLLEKINLALDQEKFRKKPLNLYEPIDYTLSLGGKRLRPVLVLMAAGLFGTDPEKVIYPALGIEIFHNFTLVHDDIMDNAPIRRGKPSVYKKWSPNIAILSGDTMFAIAYEYLAKADKDLLPEVIEVFTQTAREVCEGQQHDMDFEAREDVSLEEYLEMIRLKTAVLLAASLKTGAILSRAGQGNIDKLYACGINMGMAFQLMDDLLDTFSDPDKFGKKTGGDIIEGKKTYLYLKALELADEDLKTDLRYKYSQQGDPVTKVREIKKIFNRLRIESLTRKKVQEYSDKAVELITWLDAPDDKKKALISVIEEMTRRDY